MAAMGLLRYVHPDRLTPQRLLDTVLQETASLYGSAENPVTIRLDGLAEVGRAIFRLIGLRRPEFATERTEPFPFFTRSFPTWRTGVPTVAQSAC
jgi:predicted glycosyltransferase